MMRSTLALAIIRLATPPAHREFVVGDTLERAAELERAQGVKAAARWLWREAWRVAVRAPQHRLAVRGASSRPNAAGDGWLRTLWLDTRYTLRVLKRAPLFTAVAVTMLALGLGANTAMFAVMHAVLLKPLPFAEPERLMLVHLLMPQPNAGAGAYTEMVWSYPKYRAFTEMQDVFEETALFSGDSIDLTHVDEPEQLASETITDRYLTVLGIAPLLGRAFSAEEAHVVGGPAVALIGEQLWARRFARDPAIVGRTIHIDRQPYTVVGVLPPGFRGLTGEAEIWVPQAAAEPNNMTAAQAHGYRVVARRKAGVSEEAVLDAVRAFGDRIHEQFGTGGFGSGRWSAGAVSLADARVDADIRTTTLLLLAGVSLVLLIACANLAALLVTRALARHRDVAIRLAIGATKQQIVRQLLVEVVVLVAVGAIGGVAVALGLLNAATALLPDAETFFRLRESLFSATPGLTRVGAGMVGLDAMTFSFAVGISLVCAALIVVLPARQASSAQPIEALKAGAARYALRARLRDPLVVAQIALALVLLAGAGLMLKSVWRLQATGVGVDAKNVVAVQIHVPRDAAAPEAAVAFIAQFLERARALPGIESAALGSCMPASGGCASSTFSADEPWQPGRGQRAGVYMVSEDYAETLGIRLIAGRAFSDADYALQPRGVLVNEAAAQAFWPGRDPVGAKLATFGFRDGVEVVGVVSNVRYQAIETPPQPDVYLPLSELSFQPSRLAFFVRSPLAPETVVAMLRSELRALDPNVTLTGATTMEERLRSAMWRTRLTAWLLGAFAALAVLLTAIGIFGLMAQVVAQRSGELAVRIALGAQAAQVLRLVIRRVVVMTVAGLAIGVAGALALSRVVGGLLYDVPGNDPGTLLGVAFGLGVVALAAGYLPARRAARIDPMTTLKSE
jgi:putative ABC transport system permease protein